MDYKREIIKLLFSITDKERLEYLYLLVKRFASTPEHTNEAKKAA